MSDYLMLGGIRIQRLADGSRLLRHPNGRMVTETARDLADGRAALVEHIAEAQAALVAHDALAAQIAALEPVEE